MLVVVVVVAPPIKLHCVVDGNPITAVLSRIRSPPLQNTEPDGRSATLVKSLLAYIDIVGNTALKLSGVCPAIVAELIRSDAVVNHGVAGSLPRCNGGPGMVIITFVPGKLPDGSCAHLVSPALLVNGVVQPLSE